MKKHINKGLSINKLIKNCIYLQVLLYLMHKIMQVNYVIKKERYHRE